MPQFDSVAAIGAEIYTTERYLMLTGTDRLGQDFSRVFDIVLEILSKDLAATRDAGPAARPN